MDEAIRERIHDKIFELSKPRLGYYSLICLSTIIAGFGLLSNSTAVVIGAMLVAPLMGPIFGIALSMSIDDRPLLGKSLISEISGIFLVLGLAVLIGLIPLRPDFGSEILARTQPTVYDIVIAFASGLAGAYALLDDRVNSAIVGVAIATALVPPLTTCGLCIAANQWTLAGGAFFLFFANLVSIELAASLVFFVFGLVPHTTRKSINLSAQFFRRFGLRLLVFGMLSLFMTNTLVNIVTERHYRQRLQSVLETQVSTVFGAKLLSMQYQKTGDGIEILADVVTPREFTPDQVTSIEDVVKAKIDPSASLVVRSLISHSFNRFGPVFLKDSELVKLEKSLEEKEFSLTASRVISEELFNQQGAQLDGIHRDRSGEKEMVYVLIRTPKSIEPASVGRMERRLSQELGRDIRLIVRSILTRDADSAQYLYEDVVKPDPVEEERKRRHEMIHLVLSRNVPRQVKGAVLRECRHEVREGGENDGKIFVFAEVVTPKVFTYKEVQLLESMLGKMLENNAKLTIRSILGDESTSSAPVTPSPTPTSSPGSVIR